MRKPSHRPEPALGRRPLRVESLEDRRVLATITVTSPLDNTFLDSQVTLREAVMAANLDISVNGSEAGDGADTIVFDPSLAGQTILLGGSELVLTDDLTIDATALADDLTIDAQANSRLFNITAPTGDFTFAGLTLTGGRTTGDNADAADFTHSGGAIRSLTSGALTLNQSTVTGNRTEGNRANGGGIFANESTVIISRSTISSNRTESDNASGGGLALRFATANITDSTLSDNASGYSGGGVHAAGTGSITITRSNVLNNDARSRGGGVSTGVNAVTIMDSTFRGNRSGVFNGVIVGGATNHGGGVHTGQGAITVTGSTFSENTATGSGGGLYSLSGNITVTNSTLSGNLSGEAGGGLFNAYATVTLDNSTVVGNSATLTGGGVAISNSPNDRPLTIQNSIVANNFVSSASGVTDVLPDPDSIIDIDYSLIGDASGFVLVGSGNLIGDRITGDPLNPLLGPLADNGAATPTHAPLPGSPIIDAGDPAFDPNAFPSPLNNDQRGAPFVRVSGGRIDIGAFETQPLVVDSPLDAFDGDVSPGQFTLREAIALANNIPGPDTITFAEGAVTIIGLQSPLPTITEDLAIVAPGDTVAISAASIGNPNVDGDGARLFTIDDGVASNRIDVTLSNLGLFGGDPSDALGGGAILNREDLEVIDSQLFENIVANGDGGAINSDGGGNLIVTRTEVSNNRAADDGGGLFVNGELQLIDSTVNANGTTGAGSSFGGGLFLTGGDAEIRQSTVSGNFTLGTNSDGGGIVSDGFLDITSSTVTNNQALGSGSNGGGLFKSSGDTDLRGSILSGNSAAGGGDNFDARNQVGLGPQFSLIGSDVNNAATSGSGNVVNNNPLLGPLANNGGPTQTHLPQAGSPAIDAGNPAITSGVDQRGAPFARLFGARVDIGAVEVQPEPLPGDYNNDNVVDLADYTVWRDHFGQTVTLPNEDPSATPGQVTIEDYDVWRNNFGATRPAPVAVAIVTAPAPVAAAAEGAPAAPPLQQPAFVEPEPEVDAAFAAFIAPSVATSESRSAADSPATPTGSTADDTLLLIALGTPEADSETPAEFAALDDAHSEEETNGEPGPLVVGGTTSSLR